MREVRKRTRRKMKIYAVDAAMIFLAAQMTIVINADRKADASPKNNDFEITRETEPQAGIETNTFDIVSEKEEEIKDTILIYSRDWGSEDAEILLKIAMAEAEGESTEGKALVMCVVLNRVWADGFPDNVEDVVFEKGQFTPTCEGGRYWTTEPNEDCYEALRMIENGWDESQGALFFCESGASQWMETNKEFLFTVGNHSFYR